MAKFSLSILCVMIFSLSFSAHSQKRTESSASKYVPVTKFDPERDAEADIKEALLEARRVGKRVLLDVGGEWCIWCHRMDEYFEKNPKLRELRDRNFIMVKINFSPENKNEKALSRYPEIPGYPHLFVLESDGKLLHSQNTGELEAGKSYDLDKFTSFLKIWSPQS